MSLHADLNRYGHATDKPLTKYRTKAMNKDVFKVVASMPTPTDTFEQRIRRK